MSGLSLIVNLGGVLLIIFVLWWFFLVKAKTKAVASDQPIMILVKDGVYDPSRIEVPAQKEIRLHFIRKDKTPCAATLLFPQLNTSYELPIDESIEVIIPPQASKELDFTCQMAMYRGKLIIV